MSALNWIRSKAIETTEVKVLGGQNVEIKTRYFRGRLSQKMERELAKSTLINEENEVERVLNGKLATEYWHTTYTVVA